MAGRDMTPGGGIPEGKPRRDEERHRRHGVSPSSLFHPFELAVCGQKGSGQTRLITDLIARLAPLRVGYAKKDIHGFQFDQPGKDTQRAGAAGAAMVWIESPAARAHQGWLPASPTLRAEIFADCDLVLAEGWRHQAGLPRLLLVDGLDAAEELPEVAACVTADPKRCRSGVLGLPPWLQARPVPLFHLEDGEGVARWLRQLFQDRIAARPLKGVVLAGGRSTRMGRDKALLEFDGLPLAERAARLLDMFCVDVRLSVRGDHAAERSDLGRPLLVDRHLDLGPAGGILSALEEDPAAAWLVLGCDLPLVTPEVLRRLLQGRDPWRVATAYDSPLDGQPEPLCAVWEPRARQRVLAHLALGRPCPRQILLNSSVNRLVLESKDGLFNMNRPEDLVRASRQLK